MATTTISPSKRLEELLGKDKPGKTSNWIGDAIYGVNDGLGAIFGIIAGVAGYTASSQSILVSGFFGAVASTLSMGAGAWLASKSENEILETGFHRARAEIDKDPDHEKEVLKLIYQTKGFDEEQAKEIATQIASDEERFLQVLAQEKHGIHESNRGNPWRSGIFGAASTFVGGIIPLIPFFFLTGLSAMILAAIVSLVAHFAVGAAKSMVTVRSWWASGIEMTFAGILVGVLSYALGLAGNQLIG